jgi:hypothetical protein
MKTYIRDVSVKYVTDPDPDQFYVKARFAQPIDFSATPLRKTDHLELQVEPSTLLLLHRYVKQSPSRQSP